MTSALGAVTTSGRAVERGANLAGTRVHYTVDLEPLDRVLPGVSGRHGSALCSGRQGVIQVFDQRFMDDYPPSPRRRCVVDSLRLCINCARLAGETNMCSTNVTLSIGNE